MAALSHILKSAVAATILASRMVVAQESGNGELDELFDALQAAEGEAATAIEVKIMQEWSKSGSASMDLLLERGREAMEEEDWQLAIQHFSALVDHAPEFAEGWNARATAYFRADRLGLSLADVQQALTLNPRHFGALSGLGVIMEQLDREEAALEAWRAVADLSPNRPELDETIERLEREVLGQSL